MRTHFSAHTATHVDLNAYQCTHIITDTLGYESKRKQAHKHACIRYACIHTYTAVTPLAAKIVVLPLPPENCVRVRVYECVPK